MLASLRVVNAATAKCGTLLHALDHGKLVTPVAGSNKRRRLLLARDDDEVFMTRSSTSADWKTWGPIFEKS